jgi:hypothetical protein
MASAADSSTRLVKMAKESAGGRESTSGPDPASHRFDTARKVRDILIGAGLPVSYSSDEPKPPGVKIEVDLGDDEAGGVFITWRPGAAISQSAVDSIRNGDLENSAIKRSGMVSKMMMGAVFSILQSEGFAVEDLEDDMRPLSVRVLSAPTRDLAS